jgi:sugar phosphate isomerase/epimerase
MAEFSLAHLTVLGCAPPEMTYIAARAGYDFISPRLIMMGIAGEADHNYDLSTNHEMLRQTKRALSETGLKVHDIELARIRDDIDVKTFIPAMEVAAELGAKHVISSVWTTNETLAVERFVELCELARPLGFTINLEFVTWANVVNLQQAIAFLDKAKCENTGILIDVLHFSRSRVSPEELDGVSPTLLNFVHLCDAPAEVPTTKEELIRAGRDERLYVGEGGIDVAAIVNRIPETPYSIELPHIARVKELGYAEHASRCIDSAKKYLAEHPQPAKTAARKRRRQNAPSLATK